MTNYNLYTKATNQFISSHDTPFNALKAIILIAGDITLISAIETYVIRHEGGEDASND